MLLKIILPAGILAGTIIGAGMFSLPFIFNSVGLTTGFFYLLAFSLIYIYLYIFYADLIIKTPGDHRFVGYSKIYLGQKGYWLSFFVGPVQLFFVLTVYLILAPSFLKLFMDGGYTYNLLLFWLIGSAVILVSTKKIALMEFLITVGMAGIIFLVFTAGFKGFLSFNGGWGSLDLSDFFVAGPILFSLAGSLAVPEVVRYFKEAKVPLSYLKRTLVLGSIIPPIVYGLFVSGVLGLSGNVSGDSVSGLINKVSPHFLSLVGILGFLCIISSYIIIGVSARRNLSHDIGVPRWLSRVLVVIVPLLLYFAGFSDFIKLVSFIGAIFLPLEGIFIILMWFKANKISNKPSIINKGFGKIIAIGILLVFFVVLVYEIINGVL